MTPNVQDLADAHRNSLWTPFIQMKSVLEEGPVIFERGEGVYLFDTDGRRYLDAHASLWLTNVGFGRREVIDAAYEQMKRIAFFSMFQGYSNPPAIRLGELLVELAQPEGMGKVFYCDSGSESVETALKLVRQYWKNVGRAGKYKFIARRNAYHGVTFGAMSATGVPANRRMFEPLVPGFRHISDPNCYRNDFPPGLTEEEVSVAASEALRRQIEFEGPETVAGFIAEPVQGAGGVIIPPADYLRRCREICTRYDVLFIADEVITAFGRTGTWFGSRTYGFRPDVMCFAKGLTSGYIPMGAVAVSGTVNEVFLKAPLLHLNTYAGHPVACAAAMAALDVTEDEALVDNAAAMEEVLRDELMRMSQSVPRITDVTAIGLLSSVISDISDQPDPDATVRPQRLGRTIRGRLPGGGPSARRMGQSIRRRGSPPDLQCSRSHQWSKGRRCRRHRAARSDVRGAVDARCRTRRRPRAAAGAARGARPASGGRRGG